MKHIIRASTLTTKRYLQVDASGVTFYESSFVGGKHRFHFRDILYVLMSADSILSLQVGREVFSLQVKPSKAKHQATISALLQGIAQST
jgi:hypothetical protein